MIEQTWFSMKDISVKLGVSTSTVKRLIADGTLQAYHVRGQIRIPQEELDKLRKLEVDPLEVLP